MPTHNEPSSHFTTAPPKKRQTLSRLLIVSYVTTAMASFVIVVVINCYARSYDPWLTPRHTHYMRMWWAMREIFGPIGVLGFLAGLVIVLSPLKWNQRKFAWMSLGLFALVVYLS